MHISMPPSQPLGEAAMDIETQLRDKIRAIYQEAERQAEPYWKELARLESMKPPRPMIIPADLGDSLEIRKLLQDSEEQVASVGRRLLNLPPETSAPQPLSPPPGTSATDTGD